MDQIVKRKTMKLPGENLHDHEVTKDDDTQDTEQLTTKGNSEQLEFIKVKHFCSSEDTKEREKARQSVGTEFCDTCIWQRTQSQNA